MSQKHNNTTNEAISMELIEPTEITTAVRTESKFHRLSPVKILLKILEEFKLVWNMSPKINSKSRQLIDDKLSEIKELIKLK